MENVISIKNLHWSYGKDQVLKKIDLDIEKGKFHTILGPNGSGKTTLFKIITKMLETDNSVFLESKSLNDYSYKELAKKISIVPQNTVIEFDFSVMDIVLMGRAPYLKRFETESRKDLELAEEALKLVDIWHLKDKNIQEISGGERQRAIIARAIAQNAQIMLLDEPVSHIDLRYQIELLDSIKRLNRKKNLTIVMILHDLNLASEYSDNIFLLKKGEVYSKGNPSDVLTKENIEYVYRVKVNLINNPQTDKPLVVPVYNQFI